MKRKICLLTMALSLTVCLAACGGPTSEVDPTPTAPSVAPTDSPTPSAPVPSDNIVGRGTDGAWAGDGPMDDARDVARGAVDGARDATRGVIDGMEGAAQGVNRAVDDARNAARNAADNIRGMTGTGQPYPDPITGANNTLW